MSELLKISEADLRLPEALPILQIAEGVYLDLPEEQYHRAEGLSTSRMKDLRESAFTFWWNSHMNPARPEPKDTKFKRWGKAFHKAMLETDKFDSCYAPEFTGDNIEGLLKTADDIKKYLKEFEVKFSSKAKVAELVDVAVDYNPDVKILSVLEKKYIKENEGKILLPQDDIERIKLMSRMAWLRPKVKHLLTDIIPEISIFVRDPETGIMLKARLDGMNAKFTADLKTFSNPNRKPIDECCRDAIRFNHYNLQFVVYDYIRRVARDKVLRREIPCPEELRYLFEEENPAFAFVFSKSEAPHDTHIIELRRGEGTPNEYFRKPYEGFRKYVSKYKYFSDKYGATPWIDEADFEILTDETVPFIQYQTF